MIFKGLNERGYMSLGFAILGCGRIAERHVNLLGTGSIVGAHLVAVCDIKKERAEKFSEKYKVSEYQDMHKMMEENREKIDVIIILTESGLHAKHCLELARYKKHIVVEKPMALTLNDADEMIRVCDQYGIKLFVVKQNRYNVPIQKLKNALLEQRFGKLVMGTVRVRWKRDQEYYNQDQWRGTWAHDGGVFANQASHHVDLLLWMMGEVDSVFAASATRLVNIEVEDTGVAIIRFRSGALGIIEATTAARPRDIEGSISVLGEKGMVEVGGFAVNEIKHWEFSQKLDSDEAILNSKEAPPSVYGFGHKSFLENVVSSIRKNAPALVDGLEGRKSLEVISAIYESIETRREIPLRFNPLHARLGAK